MASSSLPQFYTDYTFPGETSSQFHGSSSCPDVSALSNYFDDGYGSFNTSSNQESMFLPQVFGISSDVSLPDYNGYYHQMGVNNNNATQHFHGGDHQEYFGFSPEIKPFLPPTTAEQPWGASEGGIHAEQNTKVGRYTVEERKDRIMRYLKKKNQRNFNKTIKYVCRKTLADRRVRVRGRFARNNDTCDQQHSPISKTDHSNHSEKDDDMSDDYLLQMENDDGWLHEAMSNLSYFPCELDVLGDAQHPNTWSI